MKLCWLALLALGSFLNPGTARAFLGDDFAAVESHYGAALGRHPLAPGLEATVHETVGYRVLVLYRDGRSCRETFSKLAVPLDFTEPELAAFLKGHADGQRWDKLAATNDVQTWERPGALATYLVNGDKTNLAFESLGSPANFAASAPNPEAGKVEEKGLTTGKLNLGTLETGNLSGGRLQLGGLTTGQLMAGRLQTGKLSVGKLESAAAPVGPTPGSSPNPAEATGTTPSP